METLRRRLKTIHRCIELAVSRVGFVLICGLLLGAGAEAPTATDPISSLVSELIRQSPIIAFMSYFIFTQHKSLREAEKDRAEKDATVLEKLLDTVEKWNKTIATLVQVVEVQKEGLREVKDALRDLRDALRDLREDRREK